MQHCGNSGKVSTSRRCHTCMPARLSTITGRCIFALLISPINLGTWASVIYADQEPVEYELSWCTRPFEITHDATGLLGLVSTTLSTLISRGLVMYVDSFVCTSKNLQKILVRVVILCVGTCKIFEKYFLDNWTLEVWVYGRTRWFSGSEIL